MPRKPGVPAYRRRLVRGHEVAVVTLFDAETRRRRDYWLGPYGAPESRARYARLLTRWEEAGRRLPGERPRPRLADGPTVTEVMADYWPDLCARVSPHHAQCVRLTLRRFREHFGSQPACDLSPSLLRDWRATLSREISPESAVRATAAVLAMYRWAVAHELVPVEVLQRLRCLEPLRKPRPKPVGPAPAEAIEAVRAVVTPPIRAMIDLQLLTGMRSGEVCALRPCDVDMTGKVWLYRLAEHKTAHHGHARVVYLGPQAQAVLRPYLTDRPTTAHCFSPAESRAAWELARRAARVTPLSCGNSPGTNRRDNPQRKPKDRYEPTAYARAVARACARAGVPHWHPHQLRHNYATAVRAKYGLEAARILLGHCSALVTEAVYADRDQQAAMRVAAEIG